LVCNISCLKPESSGGKFDKEGNLTDDGLKGQLVKYMKGFADFISRMKN